MNLMFFWYQQLLGPLPSPMCVWLISVEHFALLQGRAMKTAAWKKLDRKLAGRKRQWYVGCFGCPMGHVMVTSFGWLKKVTSIQELQNWRLVKLSLNTRQNSEFLTARGDFLVGWKILEAPNFADRLDRLSCSNGKEKKSAFKNVGVLFPISQDSSGHQDYHILL